MKISICLSLNRHKTSKIFWPHQGKIYSSTCIQESSYKPSPIIHCRYKIKLSPEAPSPHFKSSAELSRNIPMKSLKQIFLKSPETFHRKAFLDHSPCTFPFWMCPSGFWGLWNSPGAAGAACRAPNASGSTEEPQLAGSLAPVLVLSGIPAQGVFIRTANLFRWSWGGWGWWDIHRSDQASGKASHAHLAPTINHSRSQTKPPHTPWGLCMARMPKWCRELIPFLKGLPERDFIATSGMWVMNGSQLCFVKLAAKCTNSQPV